VKLLDRTFKERDTVEVDFEDGQPIFRKRAEAEVAV